MQMLDLDLAQFACPVARPAMVMANGISGIGYMIDAGRIVLAVMHEDGSTLCACLSEDMLHTLCIAIASELDERPVTPETVQ